MLFTTLPSPIADPDQKLFLNNFFYLITDSVFVISSKKVKGGFIYADILYPFVDAN